MQGHGNCLYYVEIIRIILKCKHFIMTLWPACVGYPQQYNLSKERANLASAFQRLDKQLVMLIYDYDASNIESKIHISVRETRKSMKRSFKKVRHQNNKNTELPCECGINLREQLPSEV